MIPFQTHEHTRTILFIAAGVLSFPYTFLQVGVGLGLMLTFAMSALLAVTMDWLVAALRALLDEDSSCCSMLNDRWRYIKIVR